MAFCGLPCEDWVNPNQHCCFEPPEHPQFISESVAMLLRRGVIREWDSSWGKPKLVRSLQVIPKKGNTYRLILDLFKLNKYLLFSGFKYDSITMVDEVFDLDDCCLLLIRSMAIGTVICIMICGSICALNGRVLCIFLYGCPLVVLLLVGCLPS